MDKFTFTVCDSERKCKIKSFFENSAHFLSNNVRKSENILSRYLCRLTVPHDRKEFVKRFIAKFRNKFIRKFYKPCDDLSVAAATISEPNLLAVSSLTIRTLK